MSELPKAEEDVLLLHNPHCSKSRAVESILRERGIEFVERRYLEVPLSAAELAELRERLDRHPREWVRAGQKEYAATGLGAGADEATLLAAMAAHPILMERPIVVRGSRAMVGRPPHAVLELFG